MNLKQANNQLLKAVIEPRKPGAIQQIEDACAAGANPNLICPNTSSSRGVVRKGSTLLTHAIQDGASRVVEKLLLGGADSNLTDALGWTPWMASTLVDESKRDRIQELLLQFGARQEGEYISDLINAIYSGQVENAHKLFKTDRDYLILSSFRVDLVGHTINQQNTAMLELLFQKGFKPDTENLYQAIRGHYLAGMELFLDYGASPERGENEESLLMETARMGEMKLVQCLVKAGADVNRYVGDNIEWTAAFYARQAGYDEIANWLTLQMDQELVEQIRQLTDSRDPKYKQLYQYAMSANNLSTDELVAVLKDWDRLYGIKLVSVDTGSLSLKLSSLPDDIDTFYQEIEAICPDVCDYQQELLKQLKRKKTLDLWWD